MLDAADRNHAVGPGSHQHRRVEHAVLLRPDQFLALDKQYRLVGQVPYDQVRHRAAAANFPNLHQLFPDRLGGQQIPPRFLLLAVGTPPQWKHPQVLTDDRLQHFHTIK